MLCCAPTWTRTRHTRNKRERSTLRRLEAGDPSVGIGIVATALWLIRRDGELFVRAFPFLGGLEAVPSAIGRKVGGIRSRLKKLDLLEEEPDQAWTALS